jgi:hypothetical protein
MYRKCIPSNNSKWRSRFNLILIELMIPELSHRFFICLVAFKPIEQGRVKVLAFIDPVAFQGGTAAPYLLFEIGKEAADGTIAFSMPSGSLP